MKIYSKQINERKEEKTNEEMEENQPEGGGKEEKVREKKGERTKTRIRKRRNGTVRGKGNKENYIMHTAEC